MGVQVTDEHAEVLLKLIQRDDLETAGRFALEHALLAAAATGRASDQQPRAAGEWMRHLVLRAVQDIAPDAEADSKPARAQAARVVLLRSPAAPQSHG